jgi:oxygen-dependent protoporphyrinogen oxidase
MIPRREGRMIDAMTFTSVKFPDRVPDGYALMRVFFGGGAPHTMDLDDQALCHVVMGELKSLLDVDAAPLGYAIQRWPASYPQADVGHLDRVTQIEQGLPPGVAVTGSSYRGLGVPDCIEQGRETASHVISALANRAEIDRG